MDFFHQNMLNLRFRNSLKSKWCTAEDPQKYMHFCSLFGLLLRYQPKTSSIVRFHHPKHFAIRNTKQHKIGFKPRPLDRDRIPR